MKRYVLALALSTSCLCHTTPNKLTAKHLFGLKLASKKKTKNQRLQPLVKKYKKELRGKKLSDLVLNYIDEILKNLEAEFEKKNSWWYFFSTCKRPKDLSELSRKISNMRITKSLLNRPPKEIENLALNQQDSVPEELLEDLQE